MVDFKHKNALHQFPNQVFQVGGLPHLPRTSQEMDGTSLEVHLSPFEKKRDCLREVLVISDKRLP